MRCHQTVFFQHFCSSFRKHSWDSQLSERKSRWRSIFRQASFCVLLYSIAACISTTKHSSVNCLLHTRILSVFGGSTSRSFLNQVSLSLWSFGNLKKLNPFLSASLLEQSYVIQYTIVSRIHPKNMSHVWEMKPLCATGFIDT